MAAGTVSGPGVGNDTLISIESVRGSAFDDIYVATGYAGASAIGSVPATYNEFEGMAGNDTIIGNGNTALSYLQCDRRRDGRHRRWHGPLPPVLTPRSALIHFTGVQFLRGSAFADTLKGSNNAGVLRTL